MLSIAFYSFGETTTLCAWNATTFVPALTLNKIYGTKEKTNQLPWGRGLR